MVSSVCNGALSFIRWFIERNTFKAFKIKWKEMTDTCDFSFFFFEAGEAEQRFWLNNFQKLWLSADYHTDRMSATDPRSGYTRVCRQALHLMKSTAVTLSAALTPACVHTQTHAHLQICN